MRRGKNRSGKLFSHSYLGKLKVRTEVTKRCFKCNKIIRTENKSGICSNCQNHNI